MIGLDERTGRSGMVMAAPRPPGAGLPRTVRSLWPVALITVLAGALRLVELGGVVGNTFYDAAVRSMSLSWHNFFFGAFDPGAILAVDKPPLALWLQVACVKVLGFNSYALKLPETLGGTLAVPLLYDAVRRAVGTAAGLAAAATLAVLPISVLTARSDTMDSLTMMLTVAALWCAVRAAGLGSRRWLVLMGVAFGLAFNVKLLQAFLALPAVVLLYGLAAPVAKRRRALDLAVAGLALVVVSLSWAVAVSLAPGRHPFPVGSTDGTVWNAMFVFNGLGRATGSVGLGFVVPPGPVRLLGGGAGHLGELLGSALVAAVALAAAAAPALVRKGRVSTLSGAFTTAVMLWGAVGVVLFSVIGVLKVRYLDAVAPALAATVGCGIGALIGSGGGVAMPRAVDLLRLAAALACCCGYAFAIADAAVAWSTTIAAVGAIVVFATARGASRPAANARMVGGALALGCCLVFPLHQSLAIVGSRQSDAGGLLTLPARVQRDLWRYLGPRTIAARYELAVDEPFGLAPLIIHDGRPILPLTSYGTPIVTLGALQQAVRSGAVRYALLYTCKARPLIACGATPTWVRQNGLDTSAAARLPNWLRLYRLGPPSRPSAR